MAVTRAAPLQFTSALQPLLDDLHRDVLHHQEVQAKVRELQAKYRLPDATLPGDQYDTEAERTAFAFQLVFGHVLAVKEHSDRDFVLLPAERCSEGNALFHGE